MSVQRLPRMRGNTLLRVAGRPNQTVCYPLHNRDAFLSLYTDGTTTLVRPKGGRWQALSADDAHGFGDSIVRHHSRLSDGSARVIVIEALCWEWGVQMEPGYYYNLAKIGAGSALFRSKRAYARH